MRKKVIIGLAVVLAIILAVVLFGSSDKDKAAPQFARVMQGKFEVLVNVTGELKAQNSENIMAPTELRGRTFRISEVKIQDLIAEGTLVDSGDYVATLDRAALSNQLKSTEDELEKSLQAFLKVQLDTTLQLRELRNNLINLKFDMEEKQLVLEQSKYEPPATQRQAQINLDKAQRAYEQEVHNYTLKKEQAEASMKEVAINLQRQKRERQDMLDVLDKFEIRAPKPGMLIYYREWNGQKRKVGSSVSPWDLIVATLPDLSVMNSSTYVNEIDISKIKTGQPVRITVDAFPEKKFTGEVIEVANIGEQLPNTDAKVFEVTIRVNEYDPILRPSMTTGNQIITNVYDSVTYIPLEALHANDSISYVYTRKGKMQVVVPGEMNENFIIIEKGLEANDEVYLSMPEKPEKFSLAGKELISVIKKKKEQKIQDEMRLREVQDSAMKSRSQAQKMMFQMNGQQVRKNGSAPKINSELKGKGNSGSNQANPKPTAPKS